MLAADVSRINFPALSTISGVEKLASFFLVSFLLFFKRQARIDGVSRVYRQGNSREGSSLWNSSFSAFSARRRVGSKFPFVLPRVSFALHQRCTSPFHGRGTQRFCGRTRKCWKFIFLEVGPTCFQGGGCNLRYKRFEGLISGVVGRNFRKFL